MTIVSDACVQFTSGLYNKHFTIINENSSIVNKWQVSLTDNTRVIIYDRNMFIIQATGVAFALARVINYAPRVMLQIVMSHIGNSRGIIYYRNMFIVQATYVLYTGVTYNRHLRLL